jgi:hypothetical protein
MWLYLSFSIHSYKASLYTICNASATALPTGDPSSGQRLQQTLKSRNSSEKHLNDLKSKWFLKIEPEINQNRAVVGTHMKGSDPGSELHIKRDQRGLVCGEVEGLKPEARKKTARNVRCQKSTSPRFSSKFKLVQNFTARPHSYPGACSYI